VVTELAARLQIPSESAPVSEALLRSADEIWLAFATRGLLAVTTLDSRPVGSGRPGPLFQRMRTAFLDYIQELAGTPAL
jgi:D-alanine transaminase